MTYNRECGACGAAFTSTRSTARWCGDACRTAAKRARAAGRPFPSPPSSLLASSSTSPGPVVASVTATLARMRAESSHMASVALSLADRLDRDVGGPAAGVAALSRELRAVMAEIAREHHETADDPLSRMRERYRARRGE